MRVSDEEILKAIRDYEARHGYSPSIRDVGMACGGMSPGSMKYRIARLRDKGLVTYEDGKPRTLKVV